MAAIYQAMYIYNSTNSDRQTQTNLFQFIRVEAPVNVNVPILLQPQSGFLQPSPSVCHFTKSQNYQLATLQACA